MNEGFVDVAAIEKELQKLWADMGAQKDGEREAVTRACVHNLVVYAPGENSDAEVNAIIGEVTVQNPGRVVILLPDPSKKEKKRTPLSQRNVIVQPERVSKSVVNKS